MINPTNEERVERNNSFDENTINTAIQMVLDVDKAIVNFRCSEGRVIDEERRRQYLPLVLDLLHRSNTRDDARSGRRLLSGYLGMTGFLESECDL